MPRSSCTIRKGWQALAFTRYAGGLHAIRIPCSTSRADGAVSSQTRNQSLSRIGAPTLLNALACQVFFIAALEVDDFTFLDFQDARSQR